MDRVPKVSSKNFPHGVGWYLMQLFVSLFIALPWSYISIAVLFFHGWRHIHSKTLSLAQLYGLIENKTLGFVPDFQTLLHFWIPIFWVWLLGSFLFFVVYFGRYYFELREDELYSRTGLFKVTETLIPYRRITDIVLSSGTFLTRLLGLQKLTIVSDVQTVMANKESITLWGLSPKQAARVAETLRTRVSLAGKLAVPFSI